MIMELQPVTNSADVWLTLLDPLMIHVMSSVLSRLHPSRKSCHSHVTCSRMYTLESHSLRTLFLMSPRSFVVVPSHSLSLTQKGFRFPLNRYYNQAS